VLLGPNILLPLFPKLLEKTFSTLALISLKPSNPRLNTLSIGPLSPVDLPGSHTSDSTGVGIDTLESMLHAQALPVPKGTLGMYLAESFIIDITARVDEVDNQLAFEGGEPGIVDGPDVREGSRNNEKTHVAMRGKIIITMEG
jgi:hypothetical protein